jgi:hypothetical protein
MKTDSIRLYFDALDTQKIGIELIKDQAGKLFYVATFVANGESDNKKLLGRAKLAISDIFKNAQTIEIRHVEGKEDISNNKTTGQTYYSIETYQSEADV